MGWTKVVEWVDIEAPHEDVFRLVLDLKRRVQLSPLWGITEVESISPDFPQEGSSFRTKLVKGGEKHFDSVVAEYQAERKLSYRLDGDHPSLVSWTVLDRGKGARLIYEEKFQVEDAHTDEFRQSVREAVQKWLKNIQRYSELRTTRTHRLAKWFLDRYFLKLKADQRNVIAALLFMKAVSFIAFVMAALAYGVASLF
jgi:hypothetical protein